MKDRILPSSNELENALRDGVKGQYAKDLMDLFVIKDGRTPHQA